MNTHSNLLQLKVKLEREIICKSIIIQNVFIDVRKIIFSGCPGEPEKITCEEDVFKIIGLPYKDPKDRNV